MWHIILKLHYKHEEVKQQKKVKQKFISVITNVVHYLASVTEHHKRNTEKGIWLAMWPVLGIVLLFWEKYEQQREKKYRCIFKLLWSKLFSVFYTRCKQCKMSREISKWDRINWIELVIQISFSKNWTYSQINKLFNFCKVKCSIRSKALFDFLNNRSNTFFTLHKMIDP